MWGFLFCMVIFSHKQNGHDVCEKTGHFWIVGGFSTSKSSPGANSPHGTYIYRPTNYFWGPKTAFFRFAHHFCRCHQGKSACAPLRTATSQIQFFYMFWLSCIFWDFFGNSWTPVFSSPFLVLRKPSLISRPQNRNLQKKRCRMNVESASHAFVSTRSGPWTECTLPLYLFFYIETQLFYTFLQCSQLFVHFRKFSLVRFLNSGSFIRTK